ncbi:hypothetical protein PG993_002266 [Apiospora rasikravindrae]|uniref:Uncharacterized protein n=1 Tax=Apiospora rasikravindrae TaxID=990691 RepID=A0ABR1TW45_9PEZI
MLTSNIAPAIATAVAVFAPAAAAWDMKVKWQETTTCVDHGGPARTYVRDDCMPLTQFDHGVKTLHHVAPSKLRGYAGGNCDGDIKTAVSSHQCHSLRGIWSVRIEC